MRFSPLTLRKIRRFRSIKRGYYSFVLLSAMILISCFGELLVNDRALIVKYKGNYFFPTYGKILTGKDFGLNYDYEVNYLALKHIFEKAPGDNWLLMPPIPFSPLESHLRPGVYPPTPPSIKEQHYLGTDTSGRDILARLFYGFRIVIFGAFIYLIFTYLIGIIIGCAMGYMGGTFDILMQRFIEIWSNIPFLYMVIIVTSIIRPNIGILLAIIVLFSWTSMTYYMRTATYKEKSRDYTAAARTLGAGNMRIIFRHILPNTLSTLVTFVPFSIAGAITALTALDFLGFGLPPPTPSWGELLRQGTSNLSAPWIVTSTFIALVFVLTLVTFIGEAIREAFDPKQHTIYDA
jgi:microcin C transport system permease protein